MSLPRPKAILFDLDGTLVDSVDDLVSSANAVRVAYGLDPLERSEIRSYIGDGARALLDRTLHDYPERDFPDAFQRFRAHYQEHCLDQTKPYPGVVDTLGALGLPLAVVSNKPQPFTERVLEGLGLSRFFSSIVGARPKVPTKPAPDLLHLATQELGVNGAGCWMVGDSLNDVRSGQAVGAAVVAVSYGLTSRDELAAAAPDVLIDTFGGLLDVVRRATVY